VSKADDYRRKLRTLNNWDEYLLKNSGLPGPRGNLELAQVVANEGDLRLFRRYSAYTADKAPVNSPFEFLAFCGVVGLGRLHAEGAIDILPILRTFASDPRWRIREGVAMALQQLPERHAWSKGTALEQRAAAAALCEPRLLVQAEHAHAVLGILDEITSSVERMEQRQSDDFRTLRKGLAYCWSVAVAAFPTEGKIMMEKWLVKPDKDIQWVMKENLRKSRLTRMDSNWVNKWLARLGA
jgi:hypothetical protein